MKIEVNNENGVRKDNPPIFWKVIFCWKKFGQKHDFLMLVIHKNFIIESTNEKIN
jgi:hypothetical protein